MRHKCAPIRISSSFSILNENRSQISSQAPSEDEEQILSSQKISLRPLGSNNSMFSKSFQVKQAQEQLDMPRIVLSNTQGKPLQEQEYTFKFDHRINNNSELQICGIIHQIGDADVTQFIRKKIQQLLKLNIGKNENIKKDLKSVFVQLQHGCKLVKNSDSCGSSLLIVVLDNYEKKLYAANVGNSTCYCALDKQYVKNSNEYHHKYYQDLALKFVNVQSYELEQKKIMLDMLCKYNSGGCIGFYQKQTGDNLNVHKPKVQEYNLDNVKYFFMCGYNISCEVQATEINQLVNSCIYNKVTDNEDFINIYKSKVDSSDITVGTPRQIGRSQFDTSSRQVISQKKICSSITKYAFTQGAKGSLSFGFCIYDQILQNLQ